MPEVTINYLAVLVAAIASMVIGFVWYSPILFAKQWMKLMGYTKASLDKQKNEMNKTYAISSVAALVTAYVLAHIIQYAGASDVMGGMMTAFWVWLGFVAPVQLTDVLFGGKKYELFGINTGYQLACLLVAGAILAMWR